MSENCFGGSSDDSEGEWDVMVTVAKFNFPRGLVDERLDPELAETDALCYDVPSLIFTVQCTLVTARSCAISRWHW